MATSQGNSKDLGLWSAISLNLGGRHESSLIRRFVLETSLRTLREGMTWWLLILFLPLATQGHGEAARDISTGDVSSLRNRPHIHYCRSPNMETFTCWWHLPDNTSQNDGNVNFTLTYTVGKGPQHECPDYVTGGPNSCFFDSQHTQVWEVYCMTVTVQGGGGSLTSEEHCLDVADIVETDPPLNLTYQQGSCVEELGCGVAVSWHYPMTVDVQMGWVTLVYELQYRRKLEPDTWKVKGGLREPHLELLGLPVGSYVMRVRCKSRNARLWSKWSPNLTVYIPPKLGTAVPDKKLVGVLVTGVGMMALLIISIGVIPQSKRLKAFLLPPIPKPRIRGIDSALLKNGKIDEINRLFSSFQGYTPGQHSEEALLQLNVDEDLTFIGSPVAQSSNSKWEVPPDSQGHGFLAGQELLEEAVGPAIYSPSPGACVQGSAPSQVESPSSPVVMMSVWAQPPLGTAHTEFLTFPALGYSVALGPAPVQPANQGFYTCVNGIGTRGAVHLVPCLPDHPKHVSYPQLGSPVDTVIKSLAEGGSQLAANNGQGEQGGLAASQGGVSARAGLDTYTTLDDLRIGKELGVSTASNQ
uniref:Prolactin receptor-like n=1 Tax=Paramormyrops kingsleyae TaxID=1676925 RepID=A0A3B3SBR5_9TELE|nr:prolactin receptor-like isoform X2 [Paramormyrops kingsleyae]